MNRYAQSWNRSSTCQSSQRGYPIQLRAVTDIDDHCGRAMPSFCILDCRVVRFMPSLAAAPEGPPMTQLVVLSTRTIWSRSAASNVDTDASSITGREVFNSLRGTTRLGPVERMT